jgi:hypothetical protein
MLGIFFALPNYTYTRYLLVIETALCWYCRIDHTYITLTLNIVGERKSWYY